MANKQSTARDLARKAFADSGLTYADLTPRSIQHLRASINAAMVKSGCMLGSFRCHQRGTIKNTASGKYAEIKCKAHYFEGREAVSFNSDGFIGFAGWADDKNIVPILDGFHEWVRATQAAKQGGAQQ